MQKIEIKKIIRNTFLSIGLVASINAYSEKPELPIVRQEGLMVVHFGMHLDGMRCITLGYDTDGDNKEDTRFHYPTISIIAYTSQTLLDSYGIDLNRDYKFEEYEWFRYEPKRIENTEEKMVVNGG